MRIRRILPLLFVLVGCSSSSTGSTPPESTADGALVDDDGVIIPTDDAAPSDTTPPPSDGGTPGTDTPAPPKLPLCIQTCSTASECVSPSAAYDADNWSCSSGECKWLGCNNDAECTSTFMSSAYACKTLKGTSLKSCQKTCTKPADCVTPSAGAAYDADNWSCESNVCNYLGCKDDAECKSSFGTAGNYVCRALSTGIDVLPTAAKNCVKACSTVADCASPSAAYDADNYVCESGACRWTGCNNDAECKSSLMKPNYACR